MAKTILPRGGAPFSYRFQCLLRGNLWVIMCSTWWKGKKGVCVSRRTASGTELKHLCRWFGSFCAACSPVRYVTLCVVVQQGGEAEGDGPCGCPKGEVPATLPAAFSPPGNSSNATMRRWWSAGEAETELVPTGRLGQTLSRPGA